MSDASLINMCRTYALNRGKRLTIQKFSPLAEDTNKPWDAYTSQVIASSVVTNGIFLAAMGHGLGRLIDKSELLPNTEELVIIAPPTTGEDLRSYHAILDGTVQKRIGKVWVIQPASEVVLYVAAVLK